MRVFLQNLSSCTDAVDNAVNAAVGVNALCEPKYSNLWDKVQNSKTVVTFGTHSLCVILGRCVVVTYLPGIPGSYLVTPRRRGTCV